MVALDSSTLILLAKSELLDNFIAYAGDCHIPKAVYLEATSNPGKFDSQLIKRRVEEGKIKIREIKTQQAVAECVKVFNIGEGESEALTLAMELKTQLAVDDGKAIKAAKLLGIPYITALSFVVQLVKEKIIGLQEAKKSIIKLVSYGRYSKEILNAALSEIGEET